MDVIEEQEGAPTASVRARWRWRPRWCYESILVRQSGRGSGAFLDEAIRLSPRLSRYNNARYHHAKRVQAWLARPGCRIKLHFIPAYCPHLDPIERLWGLMHKHTTHNRCHATFAEFRSAILTFLREEVPRKWHLYCDAVSDNFRVISPKDFRILA